MSTGIPEASVQPTDFESDSELRGRSTPPPIQFSSYPDPDIIILSSDLHKFPLRRSYISESSAVLRGLIQTEHDTSLSVSATATAPAERGESPLPITRLPESAIILSSLFSFIFPVPAFLPSKAEQVMELLSIAQKYEMGFVLSRIRGQISQEPSSSISEGSALQAFALSQRYSLRDEAVRAARRTLGLQITIQSLGGKLNIMSGAFLHELWKYHQRIRENLKANIAVFLRSRACTKFTTGLACIRYSEVPGIPQWLSAYLDSSTSSLGHLLDPISLHTALRQHIAPVPPVRDVGARRCSSCTSITDSSIRNFWIALAEVVDRSIKAASKALLLGGETSFRNHENETPESATSLSRFNAQDGDVLLQSSDLTNFRVHKSILEIASPLFHDIFSLPQSDDIKTVGGIPTVHLSEDAHVLDSLITMLYPVPLATAPESWDKLLPLLAAAQKYDIVSILSSLRAQINRGDIPQPTCKETFHVYAVASKLRLLPEAALSARLSLHHPMTFEFLGEELRLFEGTALHDLAQLRKRCRRALRSRFLALLDPKSPMSSIWVGEPPPENPSEGADKDKIGTRCRSIDPKSSLPLWLSRMFTSYIWGLDQDFTSPFPTPKIVHTAIFEALTTHVHERDCLFCTRTYFPSGNVFCTQVADDLQRALDEELSKS